MDKWCAGLEFSGVTRMYIRKTSAGSKTETEKYIYKKKTNYGEDIWKAEGEKEWNTKRKNVKTDSLGSMIESVDTNDSDDDEADDGNDGAGSNGKRKPHYKEGDALEVAMVWEAQ